MILLNILASALFSYYFIEMGRFPLKWKMNFKPFNCLVCLPAWVALALYLLPIEVTEIIIVMFGSAILAVLFKTLMNKAYESGSH
jgi:ABC-type transporter Mla maintaining outer membrane lipid asymmetry permease subunit MlaE